ncbi:MAG TPA: polysaccharide deacetylase family protein [bacterium]|nr:polysaccharide deacetylase family protein [bacterium]
MRKWLRRLFVELGRRVVVPRVSSRVVVLCYHSIHPTGSFRSATPALFSQHLSWLKQHCTIVHLQAAVRAASLSPAGQPVVAITFDDGFADNYEYAFPLLREHGVPATFFLTVGLLERNPVVLERLRTLWGAHASELRPLEWPAVREMQRAGMEVGAHTYSHPNLARLDRRTAELEVRRPKDIMEHRLGVPVRLMAYPFGKPHCDFTRETVDVVSGAGYEYAAAVTWRGIRASDSPFRIPRFTCSGDSVCTLRDQVSGAWDLLGAWQEWAPRGVRWSAKGPPAWWADVVHELGAGGAIGRDVPHGSNLEASRLDGEREGRGQAPEGPAVGLRL